MSLQTIEDVYSKLGPEWGLSLLPAQGGWAIVPFRERKNSRRLQYGQTLAVYTGRNVANAVRNRLVARHQA